MKLILEKFPEFQDKWQYYLVQWKGSSPGYSLEIAEFSRYVIELLKKPELDNNLLIEIFEYIETLIIDGDDEVRTAVTTCFLENLINAVSWGRIAPEVFSKYLGKKSKEYCKAWDKYTGIKTTGL